jgi:hypothetical protein
MAGFRSILILQRYRNGARGANMPMEEDNNAARVITVIEVDSGKSVATVPRRPVGNDGGVARGVVRVGLDGTGIRSG